MATITISNASVCSGGGHVAATAQLNALPARVVHWLADELRATPSADELRDAAAVMIRAHLMGMTRAQARTVLEAGLTITVA